jgi:hypothetical protein
MTGTDRITAQGQQQQLAGLSQGAVWLEQPVQAARSLAKAAHTQG